MEMIQAPSSIIYTAVLMDIMALVTKPAEAGQKKMASLWFRWFGNIGHIMTISAFVAIHTLTPRKIFADRRWVIVRIKDGSVPRAPMSRMFIATPGHVGIGKGCSGERGRSTSMLARSVTEFAFIPKRTLSFRMTTGSLGRRHEVVVQLMM
jgi:hypothetical protein